MTSSARKRPASSGKKTRSTKRPQSAQPTTVPEAQRSGIQTTQARKTTYDEPLPFLPYRPVPVSSGPRRPSAAEAYTPDRATLDEVLEQASRAAAALRQIAGPDHNTDVAIRARLDSLANHLQEVARYLGRQYQR